MATTHFPGDDLPYDEVKALAMGLMVSQAERLVMGEATRDPFEQLVSQLLKELAPVWQPGRGVPADTAKIGDLAFEISQNLFERARRREAAYLKWRGYRAPLDPPTLESKRDFLALAGSANL